MAWTISHLILRNTYGSAVQALARKSDLELVQAINPTMLDDVPWRLDAAWTDPDDPELDLRAQRVRTALTNDLVVIYSGSTGPPDMVCQIAYGSMDEFTVVSAFHREMPHGEDFTLCSPVGRLAASGVCGDRNGIRRTPTSGGFITMPATTFSSNSTWAYDATIDAPPLRQTPDDVLAAWQASINANLLRNTSVEGELWARPDADPLYDIQAHALRASGLNRLEAELTGRAANAIILDDLLSETNSPVILDGDPWAILDEEDNDDED